MAAEEPVDVDITKCDLKFVMEKTMDTEDFLSRGCLAMVTYMGRNGQIITEKRFIVTYLSFFAQAYLNKPVWQGSQFQVKDGQEIQDMLKELIPLMNKEITPIGLRFCQTADEENGRKYVVLVTERPHSKALDTSSIFSADECFLVNKFVEEIFKSPDNTITRVWAMEQARKLPKPMSVMKAEEFLRKLFTNHWLKMFEGAFALGPRAIAELETNKLFCPDKTCNLCNRDIYCKANSLACSKCDLRTHLHCRKQYAALYKADMIECKDCEHKVSREDWLEPPKKKARRISSGSDSGSPPPSPRRVQAISDSD